LNFSLEEEEYNKIMAAGWEGRRRYKRRKRKKKAKRR
jgi:hypothetical protein